jgi:hypothetical protein
VDDEIIDVVHLVHVVEDQCLPVCQTQSTCLVQERAARYEVQYFVMMSLADFPQLTVAGKHPLTI